MQANYVVALDCEAAALIAHFRLKRDRQCRAYPLYLGTALGDLAIRLVVAGVGKVAAAAATAYLAARCPTDQSALWINLGIAGHASAEIGDAFWAHKVTEASNGRSIYPNRLLQGDHDSLSLLTVDEPAIDYPEDAAVDMEAAAYCHIASRFTTLELLQCFKVISDNLSSGTANIRPDTVAQMVSAHLPELERVMSRWQELADTIRPLEPRAELDTLLPGVRLSHAQRHKAAEAVRRLRVLGRLDEALTRIPQHANANIALDTLQRQLEVQPICDPLGSR